MRTKRNKNKAPKRTRRAGEVSRRKARGDGFYNGLSGLGIEGRDRRLNTSYSVGFELAFHPTIIRSLMRSDAIARKVVAKTVNMAFAGGLKWRSIDSNGVDLTGALKKELRRLKAIPRIKSARIWGKAFGQALLLINADDGNPPDQPLNLNTLQSITHLRKIEKPQIQSVELDQSGGVRDGEPEYYLIRRRGGGSIKIHYTRAIEFTGLEVDDDTYTRLNNAHDTVLQPLWDELRDHQSGGSTLSSMLEDSIKVVWKIQGLHDAQAAGDREFISEWMRSMSMFTSTFRSMGLDAESESIEHLAMPLKPAVDTFLALMHRLAAAADMPMTELFGVAPSGLSSDDKSGTRRFYDRIRSEEQQGACGEALDRLIELISAQRSSALFGAAIDYDWPSLWSPTAKETGELNKLNADTHAIMVSLGAWGAEQAAAALAPSMDVELVQSEVESSGTILDPTERVQQARLAIQSGILHLPDTAPTFRPLLGLEPLKPGDLDNWVELVKSGGGGEGEE